MLASIQQIKKVTPISDELDLVTINGWEVAAVKGLFAVGQACLFIKANTLIPLDRPLFEFLREAPEQTHYHLHPMRVGKHISQGLCFTCDTKVIGHNLTDYFNITPVMPPFLGECDTRYSLEEPPDLQDSADCLGEYEGQLVNIIERPAGLVVSYRFHPDDGLSVSGLEGNYPYSPENPLWQFATEVDMAAKLSQPSFINVYVNGFLVGPGIYGNKYELEKRELIVAGTSPSWGGIHTVAKAKANAAALGMRFVPGITEKLKITKQHNMEWWKLCAQRPSQINPNILAHGITLQVGMPYHLTYYKVINPEFQLLYWDC